MQSLDDKSDDARPRVPARTRKALVKRKRTAEGYNSPKRVSNLIKLQSKIVNTESDTSVYAKQKQRNDINKKMRTLQDLLPNYHKVCHTDQLLNLLRKRSKAFWLFYHYLHYPKYSMLFIGRQ